MDIYLNFKNESREAIAFYDVGNNVSLVIQTRNEEETKRLFESLAEGGKIEMPLDAVPWAQLYGMVTDRFGINWQINQE
ncbi:TPA: VOC family protein [Enterococcus faecium]